MSQPLDTKEPAELSLGQRIFVICLGFLGIGLGILILSNPLNQDFETSGERNAGSLGFLMQLLWNPIGAIAAFIIGGIILLVAFLPNQKKNNSKKPQSAQDLETRTTPRNTIIALLPEGNMQLSNQALQNAVQHFYPDQTGKIEVIELPQTTPQKWLARARFGDHVVRLKGRPEPISQAVQQETLSHSAHPSAMLEPMYAHQAHIALQYERGSDQASEQLEALHIVASALLEQGLLGIADEQASNALPRLLIERNYQTGQLLEYKELLPSEMYTGTVQKAQPDGTVWFATRGFERFELPNFAYHGHANELNTAHDLFNHALNYMYTTKTKIDADHTSKFGDHHVKFSAPEAAASYLGHGNTPTLVMTLEEPFDPGEAPDPAQTALRPIIPEAAQPEEPRAAPTTPMIPTAPSRHKPLNPAELEWLNTHGLHALRLLGGFSGKSYSQAPSDIPEAMDIIADMVDALSKIKTGGYSVEQKQKVAMQLGLLWGQQTVQAYGFTWARPTAQSFVVIDDENEDIDPVELIQHILIGEDEPIKASAIFNMSSPLRKSIELDIPAMRLDLN
jgi:hypothetical protein